MLSSKIENTLIDIMKKLSENMGVNNINESTIVNLGFYDLYNNISNKYVRFGCTLFHKAYYESFKIMNERLPSIENTNNYFWAANSRDLILYNQLIEKFLKILNNTPYSMSLDDYIYNVIQQTNKFLNPGGGDITIGMNQITLYHSIPIFLTHDYLVSDDSSRSFALKQVGHGSYATVFKFKDPYYNKYFAIKRAKNDLSDKELKRFKLEFESMKKIDSPYVVEAYKYVDDRNEYIMEFMDDTLESYINKNNNKLTKQKRISLALQLLKALEDIHSYNMLHRDLSINNVLIRQYKNVTVLKVSDFGLVKQTNSNLTDLNTELKGAFNDPALMIDGFSKYSFHHEVYALTRVLYFILTGKLKIDNNLKNGNLKKFINKGMNSDKTKRFKNISEIKAAILNI